MSESTDVQALAKISTEVDESQIKTILSSQCIKAQILLVHKLRKQTKQHKEVCNFMSSANFKLQSEINLAEKEIIILCQQTLKSANVELKKELLIAKENKVDIIQRIKNGEKKYENLWLECKSRFESIPHVKKLIQAHDKAKELRKYIEDLQNQTETLCREIDVKRKTIADFDKKRILELAKYIIEDRPNDMQIIQEINLKISELTIEINERNIECINPLPNHADEGERAINNNQEPVLKELTMSIEYDLLGPLVIPKIHESIYNSDVVTVHQIEHTDTLANLTSLSKPVTSTSQKYTGKSLWNRDDSNQRFYSFFERPAKVKRQHENYSNNKIINILEDVKIDKSDAINLISKVIPEKLQPIQSITPVLNPDKTEDKDTKEDKECKIIIDQPVDKDNNILIPPTQFSDAKDPEVLECNQIELSNNKSSQQRFERKENTENDFTQTEANEDIKKKVTFSLTPSKIIELDQPQEILDADETLNSQLNASAVSEDDYAKIKDMIFKKHNLDLSPQFTYTKNTSMITNDNIVTSKFFENNGRLGANIGIIDEDIVRDIDENLVGHENAQKTNVENNPENKDMPDNDIIEIKSQKTSDDQQYPVKGFLFSHGPHDIPDSLDVSISTTGFEDGDSEFPHCVDSSLLLSPKADLPMISDNVEPQSQEVPNFLTGLRKTGFSIFEGSSKDKNDNINTQNKNEGFNFNFSGEEKKNRGGLFSMFH